MKIEELTTFGIDEEFAKKIVAIADGELADKEKELQKANDSLKDLTEKVKAFDGVDVEKLKADLANAQKKYDDDMANLKLDNAVALALSTSGALDSDIVQNLIDKSIVKIDDEGKLVGFSEQLEKLKTDKAFLFEGEKSETKQMSTGMKAITSKATSDEPATIDSALADFYNV